MGLDLTRPGLFRSVFYFLLLYALFRWRAYAAAAEEVMLWREAALFGLSLLNAFYVTRILSQNLIYLERTYVPALIYALAAVGYTTTELTLTTSAVAFLLILALDSMVRSYKKESDPGHFLNASIALGAAPLLYAPAVVFVWLLPVGLILFKQGGRSVATAILGYLLPVFFLSYIRWGMGGDFSDTVRHVFAQLSPSVSGAGIWETMRVWDKVLAGIFLFLAFIGGVEFSRRRSGVRRRAVRGYVLFVWVAVLCAVLVALPGRGLELLPVAAVPLAAIIPACFNRRAGWWPNLLYTVMMMSVVVYNLRFLL